MEDLQVQFKSGMFNTRVVGVCVKNDKVLVSKLKGDKYWTFVGGKPNFGESTEETVLREYEEEIGVNLNIDRLVAVIENFFQLREKKWHQYIFLYLLKDENNALELFDGERQIKDTINGIFKWMDISDLNKKIIAPACFADILKNPQIGVQHIINK